MPRSTEFPHNKKQAAAQVAKLKKANAAKKKMAGKSYGKKLTAKQKEFAAMTPAQKMAAAEKAAKASGSSKPKKSNAALIAKKKAKPKAKPKKKAYKPY